MNKVIKGLEEEALSIAKKYLDKKNDQVNTKENFGDSGFQSFSTVSSSKRDKSKALLTLKNGKQIEVDENSYLYEKLLQIAKRDMLMIDAEHYINVTMISEFEDVDRSIDYSKKDVVKEEQFQDESWKDVFGEIERS
ncbi:hypothetical protein P4534_18350 [Peribacillus butanolivorans]|uniref:hypothetical protein n=1 Tax=Peribacillus butanolivorans TaxID=421767 RepID=UPI002E214BA1|nr:hypothetical protein [Peribacillus butanolivorans]